MSNPTEFFGGVSPRDRARERNFTAQHPVYPSSLLKRVLDLIMVLAALPAALLLIFAAAFAILMCEGRPIFYSQERVGFRGRMFRILKLRTMASSSAGHAATLPKDPRITPLGKILRQYRIDELPQLLNVLKGEMSLIGPRPEQPRLVEEYRKHIPEFDQRHLVKPGLTGLAQIRNGYAANLEETRRKVEFDLSYVRHASFWLDAKIMAKTIGTVLRGDGAR